MESFAPFLGYLFLKISNFTRFVIPLLGPSFIFSKNR